MRKWRENNPEKVKEASRGRYQKNKDTYKAYQRKQQQENPTIIYARNKAYRAQVSGLIEKHPCVVCGDTKVEKHHPDYSRPLDVIWLCPKHHRRLHVWKD